MDNFPSDHSELVGEMVTMDFGPGGRIYSLWATDPSLPEEGEEFQFILPPLAFGGDKAENLYPGTLLVGARTSPEDPWIFSRNSFAQRLFNFGSEEEELSKEVQFEYQFPLLPELEARGKFYEEWMPFPEVIWEIELRNRGRVAMEIGELGFPLAFNTFYDGFGWTDEHLKQLWNSRVYVQKYIGGAASWVYAQRMTSEPPGLLVVPLDQRGWEFFASIPSSLTTTHQWEGIPVVYAYSRATVEREGWAKWWNEHTSTILEPRDSLTLRIAFVPTERDRVDGVGQTLEMLERPSMRVLPSAVAPVDVGIGVEVSGTQPTRFLVSKAADLQTDSDESGGFCFVKPKDPGRLRLTMEDQKGRKSHAHLLFTEPIEELIRKRANYIATHQTVESTGSPLFGAFANTDTQENKVVEDPRDFATTTGIECALAEALFLAEKNSLEPNRSEIALLDRFIEHFLLDELQNPGTMTVGSILDPSVGIGTEAGRPMTYPVVFCLYEAMSRIASLYGETKWRQDDYLRWSGETALALFKHGWRNYVRTVGLLCYSQIYGLLESLEKHGLNELREELEEHVRDKAEEITKQSYPYAGESILDTSGFEDVFAAALYLGNEEHAERTLRCAFAPRSLAPSWWWYGSDMRHAFSVFSNTSRMLPDHGEACLAHTTISNAVMFFQMMDRDYMAVPDVYMRLAFGGMLGPWGLIRSDGAASTCYCPDSSSRHFGYNKFTGTGSLGYFHYLREAGAYVLPDAGGGIYTFGCHFEFENGIYTVKPWDGVGKKVVIRQIAAEFRLNFGRIRWLRLDGRKRWFEMEIENPCDKDVRCELQIKGLWGKQVQILGRILDSENGGVTTELVLPAFSKTTVSGKVSS